MNLKESFRYQTFLEELMNLAEEFVLNYDNHFIVTKTPLNADGGEEAKIIKPDSIIAVDNVIVFMQYLVNERNSLCEAISKAKQTLDFDIDAAIASNKFRRSICRSMKEMLRGREKTYSTQTTGYRFNADGNQVPYYYNVEVDMKYAYDRSNAQETLRRVNSYADEVSNEIDAAFINTDVHFIPTFDVNETFENILIEEYVKIQEPGDENT